MANFTGGSAAAPMSRVELTLSCRGLADMDVFSKSDPFIVVYVGEDGSDVWTEFKRTEVIYDNLNPDFATKLVLTYRFEEQQRLRFDVYDIDGPSPDLSRHDFLGRRECTLGELVSGRASTLPLLGGPGGQGSLLVHVEELLASREHALLRLSAAKLDKKGWLLGSTSAYLELFKCTEDNRWVLVSRTEVVHGTRQPRWRPFELALASLCNGDHHRNIRAVCWHWNSSGTPSLIGETHFTVSQLAGRLQSAAASVGSSATLTLVHPEKQKKGRQSSGQLTIQMELREVYSFLDYIRGGTELACTIAIDFTASNGHPGSTDSLHCCTVRDRSGALTNPYVTALRSVGDVIQDYDSDRQFPVLGFGARVPPAGLVSHEFFVSLGPSPYCHEIDGVVAAYEQCLPRVQLYGPTNFAPVINHMATFARQYRDGSQYFILLIITDGVITDMPQTKQAIVEASSLPLSIIIVGVGSANFDAMEELDGDEVRVSSKGRPAERDIVQFVPLSRLMEGPRATLRSRLAREVLAEIPAQFLGYMRANKVTPRAAAATGPAPQLPPDPELAV